jgi:hypothetical protein
MLHRPVAEMLRAREAAHSTEGTLANLDAFEVSP